MRSEYRRRVLYATLGAVLVSACDSGGSQEPPPTPAITVSAATTSAELLPGGATTMGVNVTRSGGYTGAVNVTAEGMPAGVTISGITIPAGSTAGTLNIAAAADANPATGAVTIRATGTGVSAQTATFTLTVREPPGFALTLNPPSISVQPGATATTTVNIARTGGFTGAVALTAAGLPTGLTASFAPASATGTTATMTVIAAAATAAATQPITIRALGSGVADATATLNVTVTAAPDFTLSVNPTSLSIQQGGSGTATVSLARTGGFTGAVNLTSSGAPSGMSVTFNPASPTADQSTATVVTTSAVAAGTYALTIQGAATGLPNRTATLSVTVTGGQTGDNVSWQFCPASGVPIWVAAQDGTGSWARVMGNANNEYSFQITNKGGIAYVEDNGSGNFSLTVYYGTRQELQVQGSELCEAGTGQTKTVNGTVVGMGATDAAAFIGLGSSSATVIPSAGLGFTLNDVEPGLVDLVGARVDADFKTNRLFIERNLNPANNSSVTVDFAGANSFAPATADVTVANLGSDEAMLISSFNTANSTFTFLGRDEDASTATSRQFTGLPADRQAAGDVHWLMGIASAQGDDNPTHLRYVVHVFQTLANRVFSFGAPLSAVTPNVVATQPYARLRLSYPVQADYNSYYSADFAQTSRDASVSTSAGYVEGAGTVNLEVPDFSGVAGWNNTWGLQSGSQTEWTMTATGVPSGSFLNPFADNTVLRFALRSGQITP